MNDNDGSMEFNKSAESQEDEEIIELSNTVSSEEEDGEKAIDLADTVPSELDDDDEILELTDAVSLEPETDEEIIDLTDATLIEQTDDEEIIDLVDMDTASSDEDKLINRMVEETLELEDVVDEELGTKLEKDQEFVEAIGLEVGSRPGSSVDMSEMPGAEAELALLKNFEYVDNTVAMDEEEEVDFFTGNLPITPDQLEKALERVIRKIFSEKIEGMLVDVIEKVVKQEIEKLNILLEDTADD